MDRISKILFFVFFTFIFMSCEDDFNTLGSDIVDDEHFDLDKYTVSNLSTTIKATGSVQTNNLPVNSLGIYNNPLFGTTKAHIVTQLELVNPNPNLGENHYIAPNDSVYIYIPYFSNSSTVDGERVYELDSIYGDLTKKFRLKIYENGYYLSDFDPNDNFETVQKYYSDFKPTIDNVRDNTILNTGENVAENNQFYFNNSEIVIYKTDEDGNKVNSSGDITNNPDEYVVKERKIPGMWINLNKQRIKERILDAGADGKLFNNNIFKEYFKGLLFEVEEINAGEGALAILDLNNAEVVIQFHSFYETSDGELSEEPSKRTLKLQMGYSATTTKKSNSINLFEFSNTNASYASALSNNNQEKLYLKGGANGSVVFIDVFDATELQTLRENEWLINEANIVFHIDPIMHGIGYYEPQRIYLYDATNNEPLLDYFGDPSVFSNIKNNKNRHGGIIQLDESGNGLKYKIRITDYINAVLNSDDEDINQNVRLGLVVTENINVAANAFLKNPLTLPSGDQVKIFPVSSVMNPLGTILYGTEATDPSKKLKLEIYYTKPD